MKYLKQYEHIKYKESFRDHLEFFGIPSETPFNEVKRINCGNDNVENLAGIEFCENLEYLTCYTNELENLAGIENLTKLIYIDCDFNNLKNLKELKNLINLESLSCNDNQLKNLDDILHLNILRLNCRNNPWEYPLQKVFSDKFYIEYNDDQIEYFKSYICQKEFLDKYPERLEDLKPFGYHKDLINDPRYAWIFDQESNGFFGLKN